MRAASGQAAPGAASFVVESNFLEREVANRTPAHGLADQGIVTPAEINWNLQTPQLVEEAVRRGEGLLAKDGPLVVRTGKHTGRSAKDKVIVRDAETEGTIWWDNNKAMSPDHFAVLKADFLRALGEKERLFVADLFGGSQPEHRVRVRVVNELAWHNLFIRTLLVRPEADDLTGFVPEFTIIDLPTFRAVPERHGCRSETVIAVNLTEKLILIGGTAYAGEMKKSVFGILNYLLPAEGVMPMHCSANIGPKGDTAVFFGLSGTGKTTLSADASRTLIGDDEHGWSDTAVFNFEGGCYAKMIRLSPEAEPEIFATTKRFGTVLENVVIDEETRELDLDDATYAENTRGAYPIEFIANCSRENMGPVPRNIVFLTADAFGVLPPIARLTPDQAMYHFLSGYTAKVAGTEIGVTEPEATFSTCFGAPFMPRHPSVYGNLLKERIAKGNVSCWLVNTGWTGGKYGVGKRMPIRETRALLNAALDGSLNGAEFRTDENFGFEVPVAVPGVDAAILNPRDTWADKNDYDATAAKLVKLFIDNFAKFEAHVDQGVREAAPTAA
jgi:phosphoenolpyruvate carboxykinase (ATP)